MRQERQSGVESCDAAGVLGDVWSAGCGTIHGIFPTPLAAEEHYRAEGWVFSQDPEGYPPTPDQPVDDVPSGRWDGYTDDQVLHLVLGL